LQFLTSLLLLSDADDLTLASALEKLAAFHNCCQKSKLVQNAKQSLTDEVVQVVGQVQKCMDEAVERLSQHLLQQTQIELAKILSNPENGKANLAKLFPKPPCSDLSSIFQMYSTVAALVNTGLAFSLDCAKVQCTPEALAFEARVFASVQSFDLDLLEQVEGSLAVNMRSYRDAYVKAVQDLIDEQSPFLLQLREFIAEVERHRSTELE
jgi:hypothetical protein